MSDIRQVTDFDNKSEANVAEVIEDEKGLNLRLLSGRLRMSFMNGMDAWARSKIRASVFIRWTTRRPNSVRPPDFSPLKDPPIFRLHVIDIPQTERFHSVEKRWYLCQHLVSNSTQWACFISRSLVCRVVPLTSLSNMWTGPLYRVITTTRVRFRGCEVQRKS